MKKLFFALTVSFSFLLFSAFNNSMTDSTLNESELTMSTQHLKITNTTDASNQWIAVIYFGTTIVGTLDINESITFSDQGNSFTPKILYIESGSGTTDPSNENGTAFGEYKRTIGEAGKPIPSCTQTYSFSVANDTYTFSCFSTPDN